MKVRELMTTELITVGSDAPLKEAARRMIESRVSGLLVTDADGELIGVITEADFVKAESDRRASKRARLLRWFSREVDDFPSTERLVGDVMTRDIVAIGPEADHAEAARLMRKAEVKRIPVMDGERLIGIVSRSDILRAFARSDMAIIEEIVDHVIGDVLWINPKRVDVRSVDGNVTLKGRLETKTDATLLAELTRRVDGVVSVDTDLTWDIDNTKLEMVAPPPSGLSRSNWR